MHVLRKAYEAVHDKSNRADHVSPRDEPDDAGQQQQLVASACAGRASAVAAASCGRAAAADWPRAAAAAVDPGPVQQLERFVQDSPIGVLAGDCIGGCRQTLMRACGHVGTGTCL